MLRFLRKHTKPIFWIVVVTFIATIFISWGMGFTSRARIPKVAIVNGKAITVDEFQTAYQKRYESLKRVYGDKFDPEAIPDLRTDVLESLIRERILLPDARRHGITVTEDEIVNAIRASFQDVNTYNQYIKYASPLWWRAKEEDTKKELLMAKLVGAIIDHTTLTDGEIETYYKMEYRKAKVLHLLIIPKKLVPADEVKQYYEKNIEDFMRKGKLKVRHILVSVKENATPQEEGEAKAKITDIYNQLKDGADFAELAIKYSDCPSGKKGGLLDYFGEGEMVPEFEKAAYKLEIGEMSPVVRTKFGYHVIKLEDRLKDTPKLLHEVEEEIQDILLTKDIKEKALKKAKKIQKMLKNKKITFEEAVKKYSHAKSKIWNGDIGVIPKRFIPEDTGTSTIELWSEEIGVYGNEIDTDISDAIFELKPGEITEVIENYLGYHILKLVKIIPADLNKFEDMKEEVINNALMDKKNRIYQDWYNALKKKANVIKIEENV
jgi:parvulin-like peptidyl-prolyl isomerase